MSGIKSSLRWLLLTVLALAIVGCSDDDTPTDPGGDPTTYATIGFVLDDTADEIYDATDGLAWKGDFSHDADTGIITVDRTWGGPFVMLADDGPVSGGGHEPEGEAADDHRWGAVVRVETPTEDLTLNSGAISGSIAGSDGPWVIGNILQTVTVSAGGTGTINAPTLVIENDPPPTQAVVTFAIDDTANETYTEADGLAWKGSFSYDPATRVLTRDGAWPGPFPLLYDDGPISGGGHEPEDGVADDHVWSVSVLLDNTVESVLEYGAIRGSVDGSDGQWIWIGSNGVLTVPAGAVGPLAAPGLTLPAHGTIDLRLVIDLSADGANLAPDFQGVDHSSNAKVKGSAWGWTEVDLRDDGTGGDETAGDGMFSFLLADAVGPHDGLLNSGQVAEFIFVLSGVEYRSMGAGATAGVSAALDTGGGWAAATIEVQPGGNRSTYVTAP